MRFVHFSDTHLGGSNFKLPERKHDFFDAFKQVIDFCVLNKPDFIIHSGDLFDTGRPDNETILFAIDQLKRLKAINAPLFIIPGSHDVSVDGTFISILERVGLLTNVGAPRYYEQTNNGIKLKGEVVGEALVCGVPGHRADIKKIYESIRPPESSKYKIFLFHHITSNVSDASVFSDLPESLLPKGMDYYAGGHWHEFETLNHEGKPLIYPGSTEYHNVDIMERGNPRGFIYYDDKPKFIQIKTRELIVKNVDCDGISPNEVTAKCLSELSGSNKGLIILNLNGRLAGVKSEINKLRIKSEALSRGYLFCSVRTTNLEVPSKSFVSPRKSSLQEIEEEYLKKQGYTEPEVRLALNLMKNLGVDMKPNDLIKALSNIRSQL